jgi:hypothetical protein
VLWTILGVWGKAELAGHRAGRGKQARPNSDGPNWIWLGANKENQAWELMSDLGMELGVAWRSF